MLKYIISMFIRITFFYMYLFFVISCNEPVTFNNPLDPNNSFGSIPHINLLTMTESELSLTWDDKIDYTDPEQAKEIKIVVEQSLDGTDFSILGTMISFGSKGTIKSIFKTNTTYYFRIYADADGKHSQASSIIIKSIPFLAPTNLKLISMSTNEIQLTWMDNSSIETGFIIEIGEDGDIFHPILDIDSNTTQATINGVFDSTTVYFFRVFAKTILNVSSYSNMVYGDIKTMENAEIETVNIEGGTFLMGNPNSIGRGDEHPQHEVTVSNFSMGKYEVNQRQWYKVVIWKQEHGGAVLNESPSSVYGDGLSVNSVNWAEIQLWISYLNEMEKTNKYRLPTEAEWEFAARGGNSQLGYESIGIDKMMENKLEWCSDWYEDQYYYAKRTTDKIVDPLGPDTGTFKVLRGGNYPDVAARSYGLPDSLFVVYPLDRNSSTGENNGGPLVSFRLVKENF